MHHIVKSCRWGASPVTQFERMFLHFPPKSLRQAMFRLWNYSCHDSSYCKIMRMRGSSSTSAQTDVSFMFRLNHYLRLHFALNPSITLMVKVGNVHEVASFAFCNTSHNEKTLNDCSVWNLVNLMKSHDFEWFTLKSQWKMFYSGKNRYIAHFHN